jgi:hypothetical protein
LWPNVDLKALQPTPDHLRPGQMFQPPLMLVVFDAGIRHAAVELPCRLASTLFSGSQPA